MQDLCIRSSDMCRVQLRDNESRGGLLRCHTYHCDLATDARSPTLIETFSFCSLTSTLSFLTHPRFPTRSPLAPRIPFCRKLIEIRNKNTSVSSRSSSPAADVVIQGISSSSVGVRRFVLGSSRSQDKGSRSNKQRQEAADARSRQAALSGSLISDNRVNQSTGQWTAQACTRAGRLIELTGRTERRRRRKEQGRASQTDRSRKSIKMKEKARHPVKREASVWGTSY